MPRLSSLFNGGFEALIALLLHGKQLVFLLYNNMAIGMYAGNSGNALYCPTGYLELLRLQDRFVYLPEMPYREVDLDKAARNVLSQEQFERGGGEGTVASWCNTATIRNVHPNTTVIRDCRSIRHSPHSPFTPADGG